MDFSFPFVFEILLFLPPPITSSPPCDFFPFLRYFFFISEELAASFQFADHSPFQLTLLILNHPHFSSSALSLAFWIFQIPRGNDVRRKGEWTEAKWGKGKSNVSRMGEGMKVTYWGVDQSGCVPRLDMRYCQKEAIFIPRTFLCPSLLPTLLFWSIAGGKKCLEGVGTSPFNAGMLDQNLTKLYPTHFPFWRLFSMENGETIYRCAQHNVFN